MKKKLKHQELLFLANNRPASAPEQSQGDPKIEAHSGKQTKTYVKASVSKEPLLAFLRWKTTYLNIISHWLFVKVHPERTEGWWGQTG